LWWRGFPEEAVGSVWIEAVVGGGGGGRLHGFIVEFCCELAVCRGTCELNAMQTVVVLPAERGRCGRH